MKEITKNVYNDMVNALKISYKMDTIFMNSESSETFELHRLILNVKKKSIKIILKKSATIQNINSNVE